MGDWIDDTGQHTGGECMVNRGFPPWIKCEVCGKAIDEGALIVPYGQRNRPAHVECVGTPATKAD